MKKLIITSIIGLALIIGGAGALVIGLRSMRSGVVATPSVNVTTPVPSATTVAATSPSTNTVPAKIQGEPVQVEIPALSISLPIIPGYYDAKTGTWTLTKDKVQYATSTPLPNTESGNTFIYGHYRKNVFASLHKIPSGGIAIIKTADGHTFYYRLSSVRTVSPNDSDGVFNYQGKPILTIQTCTGLLYEKRQLFTFELMRVA